jgi:hypothetical protein
MKGSAVLASAVLAGMLLGVLGPMSASATVRISEDRGGRIINYLYKFAILRAAGERIVIDGTCASACTMILGSIPRDRICVTPRAVLEFHSAWDMTLSGGPAASIAGNRILWSNYPGTVRSWITRHGGLHSQIIYLRGPELTAMYPICH